MNKQPLTVEEASTKYQMVAENSGLPKGYKQTEVGVIPEDWESGNLDLFWTVTDCKHITAKFVSNGYPLASIREVQSRVVDLTNAKQTTEYYYSQLIESGRKPIPGDLIMSRNATVGEIAQVVESHPPFSMGQDVCLLRKKRESHSSSYLQSVFKSAIIADQLTNLMVGSTFKRVNIEQIRNFTVPMPGSIEQRAIASVLSDVDDLLAKLDQLIAKKRDLKLAAMQQLLTGQTRLPGFSSDWLCLNMSKHASLKARIGWQSLTTQEYLESGTHFLVTGTDFINGLVNWSTCHFIDEWRYSQDRNIQLMNGDVLITKDGTIGKVGYVEELSLPATLNSGVFVIRPLHNSFVPQFLFYVLTSKIFDEFLSKITAGSTITHLYQKDFVTFEFYAPNLEEQIAIATILSDMDTEITALEARRDKSRDLKQGMMQELLTGRIRLI